MDYSTIFLLILALCFSLAALALTHNRYRRDPHDYLKYFYYKLWVTFAYTATSSALTLTNVDLGFSSGPLAVRVCFALVSLWAMTLIYGDAFFHAQACLQLIGRSLNNLCRLLLFTLLLASLFLTLFLFILAEGQKRRSSLDLLFYLAVFVNSSYTVGSSALMVLLSKSWSRHRRKAVVGAGALFICVVASYLVIAALGQLGWIARSFFNAQMLSRAILFNAFVLLYLRTFLVAVAESELPSPGGVLVGEEFLRQHAISKREQEIIQLICEGRSNDEIGRKLFISLPTVKSHVYSIFQKTGVKNRVQLVNIAQAGTSQEPKGSPNSPRSHDRSH